MLQSPKKRSWPSSSTSRRWKVRFQPPGERNGNSPSSTSRRAQAAQKASQFNYFLPGAAAPLVPEPRSVLKKSEEAGSITTTSPFLLKVAL